MAFIQEIVYKKSPPWVQTCLLTVHGWRLERHRYGEPYRAAVERILSQEHWSRDQIREYQNTRLRDIVRVACMSSPYYRQVFAANDLRPADISSVQDLPKLPLLMKQTIREREPDLMTSRRPKRGWLRGLTSGTTGSPLALWYDRETCILTNAFDRRHKIWAGMQERDWIGLLLGRVIVPVNHQGPPFWRTNYVQRQVWFSSFHLAPQNLDLYLREIRRRHLRFLEGYPSTLYVLAKYILDSGRSLPMKAVISSSETLLDLQRETIETAFQCRLFDFYASAERVVFAAECEHHAGKHLAEEYGYTEVVDEDGLPVPLGQTGYLVGTSLHNTAMPLLRYRTGDMSSIIEEPCRCGRPMRRIANITTKAEDFVVAPDGRLISPSTLTAPFKPLKGILKSQIIQETMTELRIRIVPSPALTESDLNRLLDSIRDRVGQGIELKVEVVDDISRETSGKYRWIISKVPHAFALDWR